VVTPVGDDCTLGSVWLTKIKLQLGRCRRNLRWRLLPKLIQKKLCGAATQPTDDTFHVNVQGERRHTNAGKGRPLVILEDLNPDFFSGDVKGFYEDTLIGRAQMELAKDELGSDVFGFLSALGGLVCYSYGWVCIVTTMHPRLAKYLHKAINGGTKFKIPPSHSWRRDTSIPRIHFILTSILKDFGTMLQRWNFCSNYSRAQHSPAQLPQLPICSSSTTTIAFGRTVTFYLKCTRKRPRRALYMQKKQSEGEDEDSLFLDTCDTFCYE
jgi:hypothetical protein